MSISDTIRRATNGCRSGADTQQETTTIFTNAVKTMLLDIICSGNLEIGTLTHLCSAYGLAVEINDGRVSDILFR